MRSVRHLVAFIVAYAMGLVCIGAGVMVPKWLGPSASYVDDAVGVGMGLIVGVLGGWWLRRRIVGAGGGRARDARVRCPTCGYDLEGLEVVRGVTECPECGADVPVILLSEPDPPTG